MKKKLSLLMVAFMAVAAFAGLTTWRAGSETSYTITFKDAGVGASDGTVEKTAIEDLIADGAAYVSATEAAKVYQGKEGYGIKFGSSKANGSLTLTLAQKVVPTKIAFRAQAWINSQGNADAASISINGKEAVTLTSELANYEVAFDGETEIEAITIAATKRAYITQITVFYNEAASETPADINKVVFLGDFNEWNQEEEMTKGEGNVWTKEVDATAFTDDLQFKLLVNGSEWIGNGSSMIIDAPEGWVDGQNEGYYNYILKNATTGYQTYTVTASWAANTNAADGWTLKIEGKDVRVPAPDNIDLKLTEACDIAAAVAAAAEDKNVGNIKIELTQGVAYTFNSTVELPGSLTFYGNDAVIDASALDGPMFQMVALVEPTEWTKAKVDIAGIKVKGLKNALFFSNSKNYLFEQFDINWVNVELAGDATTFDFTKGSVAATLQVTNSTFYAPTATTKSFYSSQSGQKATEAPEVPTQIFKFFNNTMYNLATGKNFFSHRQSNQKWLAYEVAGNIFVNCGKSGQVIKGMNGGQGGANPTWQINGNAFNFDETDAETSEVTRKDTSAEETTGDTDHTGDEEPGLNETVQNSVAGVVTFTDAANGDFNGTFDLAEGATRPQTLGAPMWTLTFNGGVPTVAEINKVEIRGGKQGDWASFSKNFELVKAEEGSAYTATIDLAEFAGPFDFKLVVNENIWIGTNMLTLVDEAGLVQVSETDGADFTLKNDAYQTYTVTATWQENEKAEDGWTVTIVGKDAREAAPVVFPEGAIVYDFAAAAAAGENPANKNGSAANGQAFYGWENADKTDSKRQDYKGYEWAEGSVLPEECHVWRRSDRINGNVADGGLKCPSNREMAVDGLDAGDKVIIVYDATNVEGDSKEMVWAIGDGSGDETLSGPRATATIGGADAVSGTTTIASGAEILVNSVTPAENGTGYIVFQVKKGMIIKQIAVVKGAPAVEDTYTVAGAFYNGDGEQALFLETAWDATNVKNDLEKYTDTYYFKSYAGVEFPSAGNFQVKVVKNHDWDVASYPADNVTVAITEAGKYDVSISFDTETSEVRVNVDPQFVPAEPIYTVVGAYYTAQGEQIIFGGEKAWDEKNTAADMVITEEYGCYTSKTLDVELLQGTLNYKVVKNHDWTENWGFDATDTNPDGNAEYNVSEAGKYDIIIKFNPDAVFENGYHVDCVMIKKTTGINNIAADNMDNAVIYNMQGVRVDKAQKGLYIVNGKKVVMK